MVTEYIKRGQRLGYEDGVLVYKINITELSPIEETLVVEPSLFTEYSDEHSDSGNE
jgi:hypothetical protein